MVWCGCFEGVAAVVQPPVSASAACAVRAEAAAEPAAGAALRPQRRVRRGCKGVQIIDREEKERGEGRREGRRPAAAADAL